MPEEEAKRPDSRGKLIKSKEAKDCYHDEVFCTKWKGKPEEKRFPELSNFGLREEPLSSKESITVISGKKEVQNTCLDSMKINEEMDWMSLNDIGNQLLKRISKWLFKENGQKYRGTSPGERNADSVITWRGWPVMGSSPCEDSYW